MNVSEMSDLEKSMHLNVLCDFEYDVLKEYATKWPLGRSLNMYDSANMALAWRVLNWAVEQRAIYTRVIDWWFDRNMDKDILGGYLFDLEPNKAQKEWLDKILELAIEAGLIEKESAINGT